MDYREWAERIIRFGRGEGHEPAAAGTTDEAAVEISPEAQLVLIRRPLDGTVTVSLVTRSGQLSGEQEAAVRERLARLTFASRFAENLTGSVDPDGGHAVSLTFDVETAEPETLARAIEALVRRCTALAQGLSDITGVGETVEPAGEDWIRV